MRFSLAVCLMSLALASPWAKADLTVDIVGGGANRYPLIIAPFQGDTGAQQQLKKTIESDLAMTGMVELIQPPAISIPTQPQALLASAWGSTGARSVAIGQITPDANGVNTQFYLEQLTPKKTLTEAAYQTNANDLSHIGHEIADKIYQAIFGERSFFNSRIAYVLKQGNKQYALQVADVDGSRARTVLRSKEPIMSPAWSPDGSRLAYVSFETGKPVVYVQNLSSGQRSAVANFKGSNSAPAWRPDGQALAVTLTLNGNSQIYLINANGGLIRRISNSSAIDTEPDFSPDGQSIVFTSDRAGGPQIYLQSVNGGAAKRISWQGGYNVSPKFSPDGKSVTYVRREGGRFRVVVQDLTTSDSHIISNDAYGESPSFAPNGKMILYATDQGGKSVLYAASPDNTSKVRLGVVNGEVQDPAWGPFNP